MTKPFFRTAVGGYNKSDVNEYILQKSREHDAVVGEMEKAFSEERDALIRQRDYAVSKAEEEKAKLSEKLSAAENKTAGLEDCAARLGEISFAATALRENAGNLSELSEELSLCVSAMRKTLEAIRTTEEKAKKMDRFTALFSEMFSPSEKTVVSSDNVSSETDMRDESLTKAEELIAKLDLVKEEMEKLLSVILK